MVFHHMIITSLILLFSDDIFSSKYFLLSRRYQNVEGKGLNPECPDIGSKRTDSHSIVQYTAVVYILKLAMIIIITPGMSDKANSTLTQWGHQVALKSLTVSVHPSGCPVDRSSVHQVQNLQIEHIYSQTFCMDLEHYPPDVLL